MSKITYSEIIIKVLEETGDWTPSWKFVNRETEFGWLGISGDRRCRGLAKKNIIERRHFGKYAQYKIKTPDPIQEELF